MTSLEPITNPTQILTFQKYLPYQEDSDVIYEIFWGRLIPRPIPAAL